MIFKKKDLKKKNINPADHQIKENLFLDVHKIYDKNDFFEWQKILETDLNLWKNALDKKNGPKILFATSSGGFSHRPMLTLDSLIGVALTLRNASVDFLLCDQALPVCLKAEFEIIKPELIHHAQLPYTLCRGCYSDSMNAYTPLGLTCHALSNFVTPSERLMAKEISEAILGSEIPSYSLDGIPIGQHAYAGAIRYFAKLNIQEDIYGEKNLRKYLEAGLITYYGVKRLIETHQFDIVCTHHGMYIPQGIIAEVFKRYGKRVITWALGYRQNTFVFTHDEYITQSWLHEDVATWKNMKWTPKHTETIDEYLESRSVGNKDWVQVRPKGENSLFQELLNKKNINPQLPIIGMLTNIIWDAQVAYPSRVFPDMVDWMIKTIKYFKKRKDLQLLIRIHPAESLGHQTQQTALNEIKKVLPKLPSNIFIIESNEMIDTYDIMKSCNSVIVYATTTGVELAARGVPIIIAGEAWLRKKEIALEANSEKEYWKLLDNLPLKTILDESVKLRAKKFAFHHFFRRLIPLPQLTRTNDYTLYKLSIQQLNDLLPGKDKGLDIICNGFLEKKPFLYPAEEEL